MKKIFTLFLTLFIISATAFTQPLASAITFRTPAVHFSYEKRYVEAYSFTKPERDRQIANINAAYNRQVKEAMNLRIAASKKIDLIQQLQRERNNKIEAINNRFLDYRNKHNYNHYDRNFNWIK